MSNVNKVDMSLDDIIRLNKKQRGQGQGRGRLGRGLGRGGKANKIKQFRTSLRGGTRGQGRGVQGRGGQGRGGRGRLRRLSSGISPLNRPQDQTSLATSPNKQGQGQQKQSLKQQRLKAVFALRKAKQQLARIDAQATRRQDVVNQRRGLQQTSQQQHYQYQNSNRGRGRGRGGRGRLGRQNYNQRQQNQINAASYGYNQTFTQTRGRGRGRLRRLGQNYNSSLSLNSSTMATGPVNTGNRKKRQWRRQPVQPPVSQNDGILTISLPNSDYQPSPKQQQAAENKKYNYNKRLFAQSGTNVSLSERFNQGMSETGRQVFL